MVCTITKIFVIIILVKDIEKKILYYRMIASGDELRLTEEAMVDPNYQKLSGKSTAAGRDSGNLLLAEPLGKD